MKHQAVSQDWLRENRSCSTRAPQRAGERPDVRGGTTPLPRRRWPRVDNSRSGSERTSQRVLAFAEDLRHGENIALAHVQRKPSRAVAEGQGDRRGAHGIPQDCGVAGEHAAERSGTRDMMARKEGQLPDTVDALFDRAHGSVRAVPGQVRTRPVQWQSEAEARKVPNRQQSNRRGVSAAEDLIIEALPQQSRT